MKLERRRVDEFADAITVGVTGTYYNSPDVRFEQVLATAEGWRDEGLPLVVVDGSPNNEKGKQWVEAALKARGAWVLHATVNGIASQRQQGAEFALLRGASSVLTHEPEKISTPRVAGRIISELTDNDIVVVGRTQRSLEMLPPVQRYTESLAGWILNRSYGLPEDALAGPRGYTAEAVQKYLLPYPSHLDGMNNWIYMYQNPLEAMKDGDQVGGTKVDLMYPPEMTAEETGNEDFDRKRYEQLRLQLKYLFSAYPVAASTVGMVKQIEIELDAMGNDIPTAKLEASVRRISDIATDYGYDE